MVNLLNTFLLKLYFIFFRLRWKKKFSAKRDRTAKPRLMWGFVSLINNKYWSGAMKQAGYASRTVMYTHFEINKKEDFDTYLYEVLSPWRNIPFLKKFLTEKRKLEILTYVAENYDIIHICMSGLVLRDSMFSKHEAELLHEAGCKIIAIPYGADAWRYSEVRDWNLLHGLLVSYPQAARDEETVAANVSYWKQHADIVITSFANDGIGRYDLLPFNILSIDTSLWEQKKEYSMNDGVNGVVKIIHSPNHRGGKGTEFIIDAVQRLKNSGLKVELILLENRANDEVRQIMREEADILVEQILSCTYALSAIEGMATGLPVVSRLDDESLLKVFRRYSYLNECPIVSGNHESLYEVLSILIRNPGLRKELGTASRQYASKYHSYKAAQSVFGRIYDKIWHEKDVNLINMFHPLMKDSYNNQSALIAHPLRNNMFTKEFTSTLTI